MTDDSAAGPAELLRRWLERQGSAATFVETHASVVALTGDRVYKMKKPVRFPFLDLSTPALRLRVCEREVALNRRLAPDVYLGVVAITDGSGTVIDHAVEMVRLPDEALLQELVTTDDPRARSCVRELARTIARFHAAADTSDEIAAVGTAESVAHQWRAEVAGLAPYAGQVVDAVAATEAGRLALRYVSGRTDLFDARVRAGRIRDGHGDLRTDDVFCLPHGLRVLDCLEFDDRLRWGDVLADVAFLAMDLERLGRPALARDFVTEYRSASGDTWPASLLHHWIGHRAHVRAKVACIQAVEGVPGAAATAFDHLDLALGHLRAAQVRLVLVGGSPGTGKSTLARALTADGEFTLLRSDVVRKELHGMAPQDHAPDDLDRGLYEPSITQAVYAELLVRAARLLGMGANVVLDASWSDAGQRRAAADLARAAAADLAQLRCTAGAALIEHRIAARATAGTDASDADANVARAMAARFDPWPGVTEVDMSGDVASATGVARAAIATAADH